MQILILLKILKKFKQEEDKPSIRTCIMPLFPNSSKTGSNLTLPFESDSTSKLSTPDFFQISNEEEGASDVWKIFEKSK